MFTVHQVLEVLLHHREVSVYKRLENVKNIMSEGTFYGNDLFKAVVTNPGHVSHVFGQCTLL